MPEGAGEGFRRFRASPVVTSAHRLNVTAVSTGLLLSDW